MNTFPVRWLCAGAIWWSLGLGWVLPAAQAPIVARSNVTFRVMAANLNGNTQSYQPFALRIFQGLKPDVVAIQEFNYSNNTSNDFRSMVTSAFGSNFVWYREPGSYSIPNGIISRWPIVAAGAWTDPDTGVNDRGFAWARIDLPGTNDLYVVSVHLKASSGSDNAARRGDEAAVVKSLIQSNFPANAFIVVAGDLNLHSPTEEALNTFKTFLSDVPVPTDAASGGDADTNAGRDERYDLVLPSFTLATNWVPTVVGGQSFANGLVFDSQVFSPLSAVSPVQTADSGLAQHMAVMKDFRVSYAATNWVTVPAPTLTLVSNRVIRWTGLSNLVYTVWCSTNPATSASWSVAGTGASATTNFSYNITNTTGRSRFYRVTYP